MSISEIWLRKMPFIDAISCIGVIVFISWKFASVNSTTGERNLEIVLDEAILAVLSFGSAALAFRFTKLQQVAPWSWLWVSGVGSAILTGFWAFWALLISGSDYVALAILVWIRHFVLSAPYTLASRSIIVLVVYLMGRKRSFPVL